MPRQEDLLDSPADVGRPLVGLSHTLPEVAWWLSLHRELLVVVHRKPSRRASRDSDVDVQRAILDNSVTLTVHDAPDVPNHRR